MLSQIKALLSDAQLRQKIKETNSLLEAIVLIKSAGAEKGYQFSSDCLYQLLQNQLEPLSETDLLAISGGWSGSPRCLEG
ncbi:MAG: Nif11-like leader peptide family natural product precursor [Cyanobacteria bacterium P01_A01_bin.123]